MHYLYAFLCVVLGGGISWTGYRLKAPYARPPGVTGFAGPIFGRHLLIGSVGDLLIAVGLIIAILFTLIFVLT
jgi:hypothetical protein